MARHTLDRLIGALVALLLATPVLAQSIPTLPSMALPSATDLIECSQPTGPSSAYRSHKCTPGTSTGAKIGLSGWLEPVYPYTESIATGQSLTANGFIGFLSASQCNQNSITNDQGCIGLSSVVLNNNTSAVQYAWGHYVEARRYAGAGVTHASEHDMINEGSDVPYNPYSFGTIGTTDAEWLTCGRPDVSSSNVCGGALAILDNGVQFDEGIIIRSTAIRAVGGVQIMMDMPQFGALVWREPTSAAIVGQVRSDCATFSTCGGIVLFNSNGISLQSTTGITALTTSPGADITTFRSHIGATQPGAIVGVGACGTGATVAGSDVKMKVVVGSGTVTGCTLGFGVAYGASPVCTATADTAVAVGLVPTTTNITMSFASNLAGHAVNVICIQ